MHVRTTLALIPALLLLSACGGSGPEECSPPAPLMVEASLDGSVSSDGFAGSGALIWIGDTSGGVGYRGVVRFPLADLPAGTLIHDAHLEVHMVTEVGSPGMELGILHVEHVDLGAALDASDFSSPASWSENALAPAATGTHRIDVTDAVRAAHAAGLPYLDLRLQFMLQTNFDDGADVIFMNDRSDTAAQGSSPGPVPTLTIEYGGGC